MKTRLVVLGLLIVLSLSLIGCSDGNEDSTPAESGSGMEPAQINPDTPAEKASETVDDANESTQENTYEIQELTDSE